MLKKGTFLPVLLRDMLASILVQKSPSLVGARCATGTGQDDAHPPNIFPMNAPSNWFTMSHSSQSLHYLDGRGRLNYQSMIILPCTWSGCC